MPAPAYSIGSSIEYASVGSEQAYLNKFERQR